MIESISLSNIATYSPAASQTIANLKNINFFYGANGAGKTTISRLINNPEISEDSKITWLRNTPITALVYNNDFIKDNYKDSEDLRGVFTLGKAEKEQLDRLKEFQAEKQRHQQQKNRAVAMLDGENGNGGKNAELLALETKFLARCWDQKQKHDNDFQGAFTGVRNSKEGFKARVLQESTSNQSALVDLANLKERALVLYGDAPSPMNSVPNFDLSRLIAFESSPVLKKKVIGKEDVSISALIQRLNNSDWVRQGMRFLEHSDEQCPFCQQGISHEFEQSLTSYFDEAFEADTKAVSDFRLQYFRGADEILALADNILATDCIHLNKEKLDLDFQAMKAIVLVNKGRIDNKISSPSMEVVLESLEGLRQGIEDVIHSANVKVSEHNRLVASFTAEQKKLTAEVWKYILEVELKTPLADYNDEKSRLQKAINGIAGSLEKARQDIAQADLEIDKIETSLTSVKPTVIAINKILKDFGFRSFSLDPACAGNSYRLIRADGSDAKTTLSEGEKTFVTFLYFYHLLKGSITTSGITTDRVVVIDDPVSSLDSDVLFIVSSLIKQLFTEIRQKGSNLKQIFVLTHNVHFHKEVTYNQSRKPGTSLGDEGFWIVRKPGNYSEIEFHPVNPVKTSYQLLWNELKKKPVPALTLQNTMRRILENYFKILGGIDTQAIVARFEGHEKVHCQSLISWVNDGSHYAPDELYVAIGDAMAASYMKIFFKIFKVTNHMAHYEMMMGDDFEDLDPDETDPETEAGLPDSEYQLATVVESPPSPIIVDVPIESVRPNLSTAPTAPIDVPTRSPEEPDSDIPF
ncbi:hypothetical protein E8F11_17565 [Pseudomonas sp. BN417]|uniref:AAA family ATPase n=1 Tax=Pseudomonas sp. BN417 TaxID=2567890 RepID=UPI002456ABD8|nr:AAA family ATPase [Pseudomonas sp. BN417]MDH4556951.1 hypothetical protein [Pseudomonas sp. BN417]